LSILTKGKKVNHAGACIAHAKRKVESFGDPKPVDDLCHRFLGVFHPIDRLAPLGGRVFP